MLHGLIQCIFLIYFRIYLSCGVITLVLCINKRRLLWIGECTAFAGYLFVQYFFFILVQLEDGLVNSNLLIHLLNKVNHTF